MTDESQAPGLEAHTQIISILKAKTMSNEPTSIVKRVEETMDVDFTREECAKLAGIHDKGYRVIVKLITIRDDHKDPMIRAKAKNLLNEIDSRGELGTLTNDLRDFVSVHQHSGGGRFGGRSSDGTRIKNNQISRLNSLCEREDLSEQDKSEAKRIAAALRYNGGAACLYIRDREKMYELFRTYDRRGAGQSSHGWRKIDVSGKIQISRRLNQLIARTSDEKIKARATELLGEIVGDRMPTHFFIEAEKLTADNKISKHEALRRTSASSNFSHAVLFACQACDNLADLPQTYVTRQERMRLIERLGTSTIILLELQKKLLGGENNDET